MKKTRDFADVLRAKLAENPKLAAAVEEEAFRADIAGKIYELRLAANLTQEEFGKRVGMTQASVSRLEDADYHGHTLKTLRRIAQAMNQRLAIDFHDAPRTATGQIGSNPKGPSDSPPKTNARAAKPRTAKPRAVRKPRGRKDVRG